MTVHVVQVSILWPLFVMFVIKGHFVLCLAQKQYKEANAQKLNYENSVNVC